MTALACRLEEEASAVIRHSTQTIVKRHTPLSEDSLNPSPAAVTSLLAPMSDYEVHGALRNNSQYIVAPTRSHNADAVWL